MRRAAGPTRHGDGFREAVGPQIEVMITDRGRVKPGQLVLMEAFGGGFTWGSVLMRF